MDNDPDKRWRRGGVVPPEGTMARTWFEQGFAEGLGEVRAEWDRERAFGMAELLSIPTENCSLFGIENLSLWLGAAVGNWPAAATATSLAAGGQLSTAGVSR